MSLMIKKERKEEGQNNKGNFYKVDNVWIMGGGSKEIPQSSDHAREKRLAMFTGRPTYVTTRHNTTTH